MPIDAIIFDCDGTLVDSETLASRLMAEMLAERGCPLSYDEVLARFRGQKFADFVAGLSERFSAFDGEEFTQAFRARSLPYFRTHLKAIPGALDFVRRLTLKRSVASNGPREKIETSLSTTGFLPFFEGRIVSAFEVGSWKPAPELIWAAAACMGVEPPRCLLIEDSRAGVEAGLAAGVRVIGFDMEADDRKRFDGRIAFASDFAEVTALLAGL